MEDSSWIKQRLLIFLLILEKKFKYFFFCLFFGNFTEYFFEKFFEKRKKHENDKNFQQWSKVLVKLVRVKIRKYSLRSRSHRKRDFPTSIRTFHQLFWLWFFSLFVEILQIFSAKSPVGAMSYEYQLWLTTLTENRKLTTVFQWHDQARAPKARDAALWRDPKGRWTDDEARKSRGVKRGTIRLDDQLSRMKYQLGWDMSFDGRFTWKKLVIFLRKEHLTWMRN